MVVSISLSIDDTNSIKHLSNIENLVRISFETSIVYDLYNNPSFPIESNDTLQGVVILDTTQPYILAFDLDMDSGLLTLELNEPVAASSVEISYITIVNDVIGNASVRLTEASVIQIDSHLIYINISNGDLNELKLVETLATEKDNTFLTVLSLLLTDLFQQMITSIPVDNAMQVRAFTMDLTDPVLTSFSFASPTGLVGLTVSLQFSEIVRLSTLQLNSIIIQQSKRRTDTNIYIQFSANASLPVLNSDLISFTISFSDYTIIQELHPLASTSNLTYLSISSQAVQDMNNNPIVSISENNGLKIFDHSADLTKPTLLEYSLDLDSGILKLTISEQIRITSVNSSLITLQSESFSNLTFYTLTGGEPQFDDGSNILTITMTLNDLNNIKKISSLATQLNDTFFFVPSEFLIDLKNNVINAISSDSALQARSVIPDTTRPTLLRFDIHVNRSELALYFSETVSVSSLDITQATIQNTVSNPSQSYTFTSVSILSTDGPIVKLLISLEDLNNIKAQLI